MQSLKMTLGLLLMLTCLCCVNHTLIDVKNREKDNNFRQVDIDSNQLVKCAKIVDSLSNLRNVQYQGIAILKDSLNTVVDESPMASEVIYTFDKEPIDMLRDYVSQQTDSAKNAWFGSRLLMIAYSAFDANQETIHTVRAQMEQFDNETRACRSAINILNEQINKNNIQVNQLKLELSKLTERDEQLEKEIESLNKQGCV